MKVVAGMVSPTTPLASISSYERMSSARPTSGVDSLVGTGASVAVGMGVGGCVPVGTAVSVGASVIAGVDVPPGSAGDGVVCAATGVSVVSTERPLLRQQLIKVSPPSTSSGHTAKLLAFMSFVLPIGEK